MRYTFESFDDRLHKLFPNSNFKLIEWNGIKNKCIFKCLSCGRIQEYQEADKIIDRSRRGLSLICKNCEDTAQLKLRLQALNKINNLLDKKKTILLLEEPKRIKEKTNWKCIKCGKTFQRTPSDFLKNQKCPWCEGHFQKMTIEQIKEKVKDQFGNEYSVLSEHYNPDKSSKIRVRHNKCHFIWDVSAYTIIRGHGCPKCKSSLGEVKVEKFLKDNNIYFIPQYSFEDFEEIKRYKYDFYIENGNSKFVIEYHGRQHYEPVDFFGGEEAFRKQRERDQIKKDFCNKNNIEYIEIPYYNDDALLTKDLAQRLSGQVPEC